MFKSIFAIIAIATLGGCATNSQEPTGLTMRNDWRAGTIHSPYISVATTIICDDCKLE